MLSKLRRAEDQESNHRPNTSRPKRHQNISHELTQLMRNSSHSVPPLEIRGLIMEKINPIANYEDNIKKLMGDLSRVYGADDQPWQDTQYISWCQLIRCINGNQDTFHTINFCGCFIFMFKRYPDQIDFSKASNRQLISEWQQKYMLGQSEGKHYLDNCGKYFSDDQYVQHVVSIIHWTGSYLSRNTDDCKVRSLDKYVDQVIYALKGHVYWFIQNINKLYHANTVLNGVYTVV